MREADCDIMKRFFAAKRTIVKVWTLTWCWMLTALLTGAALAAAPGQEEWERVLQAAKKEGKVAIVGPTGADRRDALTIAFEKKYAIDIEYHAIPAPEFYRGSAPSVRRIAIYGTWLSPGLRRDLRT